MNKIAKTTAAAATEDQLASTVAADSVKISAGKPMTVMLSQLRYGRTAPGGSVNVRKTKLGPDAGMLASVREKGILKSLAVVEIDGFYYPCDGDTRLDAALKLVTESSDRARYPVNVTVHPREEALEISLAAGLLHRDLHPVDEFEALAALVTEGKTVDELGRRFNLKVPQVRQALSLAAIAPKIREAWRNGQLEGAAAEAFAECRDEKLQVQTFDRLAGKKGDKPIEVYQVKRELKAEDRELWSLLRFVGREAFEANGGRIDETLFSETTYGDAEAGNPVIDDPVKLKAMAQEKIAAELKRLTDGGWAWAITAADKPKDIHAWRRLYPNGSSWTDDQKKASGCVVGIGHDGKLEVERGYVKPGGKVALPKSAEGETGAGRPKKKAKPGKPSLDISNALTQRLSETLTEAVGAALAADPRVALAALLAGFASEKKTIDVKANGLARKRGAGAKAQKFADALQAYLDASQANLLKVVAAIAGGACDLQVWHADHPPLKDGDTVALCDALDESATGGAALSLQGLIVKAFDIKDYCDSVAKPLVLRAIAETVNADEARKLDAKPKAEVVKFALANMAGKGWLPPELRTAAYAGPGSGKKPAKPTPAPKKAAAAKAKSTVKRNAKKGKR